MKKLDLFFVFTLMIVSCSKRPQADFFTEPNKAKIGSEVFFRNTSDNADSYEWDFGDGTYSRAENPSHTYKQIGTYSVKLSAFSKRGKESRTMKNLRVVEPTLLVVEVVEYFGLYAVENASVLLYRTLEDWDDNNPKRAIIEGFTDEDGIVVFGGITPQLYYVDVLKQHLNNRQFGLEDIGFIEADVISDKVQWFIAWVEYNPDKKGNARGEKRMVIKKIEKREPPKEYRGNNNGEIDYEALLKKSVLNK